MSKIEVYSRLFDTRSMLNRTFIQIYFIWNVLCVLFRAKRVSPAQTHTHSGKKHIRFFFFIIIVFLCQMLKTDERKKNEFSAYKIQSGTLSWYFLLVLAGKCVLCDDFFIFFSCIFFCFFFSVSACRYITENKCFDSWEKIIFLKLFVCVCVDR